MTADGSFVKMYVDGVLASTPDAYDGTIKIDSSSHLTIGATWFDSIRRFWKGKMDDVRVYNRALSASEVQQLYGLGAGTHVNTSSVNLQNGSTLQNGLRGLWTFDGNSVSASTVTDLSGNGYNGTNNGASPTIGKIGQAVKFGGTSSGQYINLGTNNALTPSRFTITAWIYQNQQSCFNYIYSNARDTGGPYNGIDFKVYCNGNLDGTIWNGTNYRITALSNMPAGTWAHVAFSYDGSFMRLYINGAQATTPVAQTVDPATPASFTTAIGSMGNGAGTYTLNGKLDDVRLYSRALSDSEIKKLYNMGK